MILDATDIKILTNVISRLDEHFKKICPSHGFNHAMDVGNLTLQAVIEYNLSDHDQFLAYLAGLLHDADDRKFFPAETPSYGNARRILTEAGLAEADITTVVKMVSWVSASANKDTVPADAKPWHLCPRYADRLTALGWGGVRRCWEYTLTAERPLYLPTTPRARTREELAAIATPARYAAYTGESQSMIDHYYDKLLHIGAAMSAIDNKFVREEAARRQGALVEVALAYGQTGTLSDELFNRGK